MVHRVLPLDGVQPVDALVAEALARLLAKFHTINVVALAGAVVEDHLVVFRLDISRIYLVVEVGNALAEVIPADDITGLELAHVLVADLWRTHDSTKSQPNQK